MPRAMTHSAPSSPQRADVPTGVATGRVARAPGRPTALEALNALIGRWLTEGETTATDESGALPIFASDVYEWMPGGHFVLHTAYGRIGDVGVGGVEIVGYDPATGQYCTWFYDSQGNTSTQTLTHRAGDWIWEGPHARCMGEMTDGGRTMIARHERSDDGTRWAPSMTVTLRRVD